MDLQQLWATVDTFCREYWWAGPILLALATIGGGLIDRRKRNRIAEESARQLRTQAEQHAAELNRVATQTAAKAAQDDPNRPLTPAERVCKLVRTAIGFGADAWNLEGVAGADRKMTCTRTGFDRVNFKVDKANKTTIYVGTEDVTTTTTAEPNPANEYNRKGIATLATELLNAKVVRLEEERLTRIAGEFEQPVSVRPGTMGGPPQTVANGMLAPIDREVSAALYTELVRVLVASRFVGPVQQDCNQMSDNSTVVIKSYGPEDAEVWVGGTSVLGLFTAEQRRTVTQKVYDIVSGHKDRRAYLDNAITGLKKIVV